MNHGLYARAELWFANICLLFNKCYGFHSSSALASFVIVYIPMNGIGYVCCLNLWYINVYGTVALSLAWEIRVLTQQNGDSKAVCSAGKIQIGHHDVCLYVSVWLFHMYMLWLSTFPPTPLPMKKIVLRVIESDTVPVIVFPTPRMAGCIGW